MLVLADMQEGDGLALCSDSRAWHSCDLIRHAACELRWAAACMTGGSARPLSARVDVTPPLTARKAQSSRLRGLNEKVEKLLQVQSTHPTLIQRDDPKGISPVFSMLVMQTPQHVVRASVLTLAFLQT